MRTTAHPYFLNVTDRYQDLGDADPMIPYWLTPHTYVFVDKHITVVMNLKRDQYFGLTRDQSAASSQFIKDWPATPTPCDTPSPPELEGFVQTLVRHGLISHRRVARKPLQTRTVPPPGQRLTSSPGLWTGGAIRHLLTFFAACGYAQFTLRWGSLEAALERISRNKPNDEASRDAVTSDTTRLTSLVGIYASLRTLVYTQYDHCLFDSLALQWFLRRQGFHADLVFGVKPHPFAAHCWLQFGPFVLNSSPELAAEFSPILAV